MKKIIKTLTLFLGAFSIYTQQAQAEKIHLTSLEWPPYSSANLPDGGISIKVAKEAFAAEGYELDVSFFPWARSIKMGLNSEKYSGYLPEYFANNLPCEISDSIGNSPLGFMHKQENEIQWSTLKDLEKYKIGTVRGYVNEVKFDAMAKNKELRIEEAVDDIINIRKVLKNRLTMAVIDSNVMHYLIKNDPMLKQSKKHLTFNKKLLDNKKLYVCFRYNTKHKDIFNRGLKKIDVDKIIKDYKF